MNPEPAAMRKTLLIAGLALLVVGVVFWYTRLPAKTSLPGLDRSDFMPAAVPQHIASLRSDDAAKRKHAATALWQIGETAEGAVPALLHAAKDPDPEVRKAVLKALGTTAWKMQDAIPALVEGLSDGSAEVRAAAAGSLAEIWSENNYVGR